MVNNFDNSVLYVYGHRCNMGMSVLLIGICTLDFFGLAYGNFRTHLLDDGIQVTERCAKVFQ